MPGSGRKWIDVPRAGARLALDFLLPMRCLSCDRRVGTEDGLCPVCWQKMQFIEKPWCYRLGIPFTYDVGEDAWSPRAIASPPVFDRLRSVAFYEGPARDLVLALKFSRRRELAGPMGRWMSRAGKEFLGEQSLILPVPLRWVRLLSRRFNQAADLAKVIAADCGGQYEPDLLRRRKRTRQQVGLSAKDRHRNVRSAFGIDKERESELQGRHVILIDDVMTTGSTVTACSKTVLAAGAASVNVITFAIADPSLRSADEAVKP
ncbi:ComF family protein [Roseibium salinum]|uniref:ComF family protein n=1 Tax=Roseibium salinum TaxID=1604349 RepID=A0ABT3R7H9_9HYPH|nr:ComF family protein [Roseibium sp. DSM 29163]MCX2725208.1 ComF family protein [Roseibium sp. DSM 29163]